ncbi:hypothetical protein LDJ79_20670 [Vibrio tritonius]|uniref:ABC transporter permease n=1 Tax=Vibrio tritonius TaxID=1435069 RepID=A0ABS7YS76_9VIBR|nr:hypothetical protein [Vibrio tritonius]MCA2018541.1 hypothetical protein [Vibrio tritonius]
MAFDYGSINLGIKNPFKKEGVINTIGGVIVALIGVYLLVQAAASVKQDVLGGWVFALFGLGMLVSGIWTVAGGVSAMLRYFVGRNHPTSLAQNFSESQSQTATQEAQYVAYQGSELTEMLMGRKNITFVEPQGIIARLLHSVVPRLTFMPYMIRNQAQYLFSAWVKTVLIFVVYALVAFVTLAGFAGQLGETIFPVYSIFVVLHLLKTWFGAGRFMGSQREVEKGVDGLCVIDVAKTIAAAILIPTVIGFGLQWILAFMKVPSGAIQSLVNDWLNVHPLWFMLMALAGGIIVTVFNVLLLKKRLAFGDAVAEVSELRENWQESIHPNEIFINLDNLVMANRRYQEAPNRVYKMLEPALNEQVDGKGSFRGEMTQEVQPRIHSMNLGSAYDNSRFFAVVLGRILFIAAALVTVWLAYSVIDAYHAIQTAVTARSNDAAQQAWLVFGKTHLTGIVQLLVSGLFIRAFANILVKTGHLFYAEMLFESNLIYIKVEGTFSESKISTGTGINDSTRSENVLVRSSITPWVIVSRIVSSTFASTGMRNLEYPCYILELHKNEEELASIKHDMRAFLKDRESIASITSERDLHNASQIHDINQQTRSMQPNSTENKALDSENLGQAAGYIERSQAPDSE